MARRALSDDPPSQVSEAAVYRHFDVLTELAARGRTLHGLRFNTHDFTVAFTRWAQAPLAEGFESAWENTLHQARAALVTEDWLDDALDVVPQALLSKPSRVERDALRFALHSLRRGVEVDDEHAGPLATAVFRAQWTDHFDMLVSRSAAAAKLARDPETTEPVMDAILLPALFRVDAWFASNDAPAVLTIDQHWISYAEERQLDQSGLSEEALQQALDALYERMAAEIDPSAFDEEINDLWPDAADEQVVMELRADLTLAMETDPGLVFLAARASGLARCRSEGEQAALNALSPSTSDPSVEHLQAHMVWLRENGHPQVADRLEALADQLA